MRLTRTLRSKGNIFFFLLRKTFVSFVSFVSFVPFVVKKLRSSNPSLLTFVLFVPFVVKKSSLFKTFVVKTLRVRA